MGVLLYNESCFDFFKRVKDDSIDLVLIDPPYEISRYTNFSKREKMGRNTDRFRVSMDFGKWDYDFKNLDVVIKEAYRCLKVSGTLFCFYDLWKITNLKDMFEKTGFKQLRFVEWVKTNPVSLNSKLNYLTNAREIAVVAVKEKKPIFNSEYDNGIYSFLICHEEERFHPTQKPMNLIRSIVKKHSNEGNYVLDCFSGSGTTAVCCNILKRNFIGCEINKEYFEKSLARINETKISIDSF